MIQPELTDIVAEFTPVMFCSFVAPLVVFGAGVTVYHLAQKYELSNKSKTIYSQAKDSVSEFLAKYHS